MVQGALTSLEYTTLRVPYEELNLNYRHIHRNIEQATSRCKKNAAKLKQITGSGNETITHVELIKPLNNIIGALKHAVATMEEAREKERGQAELIGKRLDYLENYVRIDKRTHPYAAKKAQKDRTARLAIWYLLRLGKIESAREMTKAYKLETMIDIDVFAEIHQIRLSLLDKTTEKALEWIQIHRSKLRKIKSTLEISVRQQDIADLLEKNDPMGALNYVRKHSAAFSKHSSSGEIQKTMSMIMMPEAVKTRYPHLSSENRWVECMKVFEKEMFRLYEMHGPPPLAVALQCGLAAHKTPCCEMDDRPEKEVDCPVCSKTLWPIAEDLPNGHVSSSRILCSLTGEECDDVNIPFLFPSGYVYGLKSLKLLTKQDNIMCAVTRNVYKENEMQRLYFL